MHGNKNYTEVLFTSFQLSEHVPEDNFNRRLKDVLDLRFMRQLVPRLVVPRWFMNI